MTDRLADTGSQWQCACGARPWKQYWNCGACGKARPEPKAEPSDAPQPEMPGYT